MWSFAVTLWELLTLSQDLPYSSLKDSQVVDLFTTFPKNISDTKKNDTTWHNVHLPKPSLCSSETYDLMSVCWSLDPSRRPSFEDIRVFLHQKVSGFRPLSEDVNVLMDLLIWNFQKSFAIDFYKISFFQNLRKRMWMVKIFFIGILRTQAVKEHFLRNNFAGRGFGLIRGFRHVCYLRVNQCNEFILR